MTIPEWLKTGKRRCNCKDVELIFYKKEWKVMIARGSWQKQFAQVLSGTVKYKKDIRWIAECNQCSKFYLASEKRKDLIEAMEISEIKYSK